MRWWHLPYACCCFGALWQLALARNSHSPTEEPGAAAAPASDIIRANFHSASGSCARSEGLATARYAVDFARFEYADEPAVHRYLRCVWTTLGLWSDSSGFAIEQIAQLYRQRANTEVLVPTLTSCNRNAEGAAAAKWCYTATRCILESRVGRWFKDDMTPKTLTNGHHQ